jgi:ribosomal protein L44E
MQPSSKRAYCSYCRRQTDHKILSLPNREGTGGKLVCTKCGSTRVDTIQDFDAALM